MHLDHLDSSKWKVSIKRDELETLICAAKYILKGGKGRVPRRAKERLKDILESYDTECKQLKNANTKKQTLCLRN